MAPPISARHKLDVLLIVLLAFTVGFLGNPQAWLRALASSYAPSNFPAVYENVFDFVRQPMEPWLAVCMWLLDMFSFFLAVCMCSCWTCFLSFIHV